MRFGPAFTHLLQVPVSRPYTFISHSEKQHSLNGDYSAAECHHGHDSFDQFVEHTLEHFHVPGLAMAIVDGDKTIFKNYGIANLPDVPVTSDTIFYGASTTKAFVTAGLSLLIDDQDTFPGLVWTTPISQLIRDDFVLMDEYSTQHVTLQDAATHRTGLPRHDFSFQSPNQTVKDVVRSMRHLPLTAPIRTAVQYCNIMFVVLGHVIESLTGQWLGDFLAARIWTPLNMTSTYFSLRDTRASGKPFAHGLYWLNDTQTFQEVDYVDNSAVAGAGAVLSTATDYAKWMRMMMQQSAPLSKAGHEALVTPHMLMGSSFDTRKLLMYGYGWAIEPYWGYDVIWHNGAENGFGSLILYLPALHWGCVMFSNSEYTSNIIQEILTWHLVDTLLSVPTHLRTNRTAYYDASVAEDQIYKNATYVRELVYPPALIGNVSISLPLASYAGTYVHPAYGPWYIQYANGTLRNDMDRGPILHFTGELEHISGDHFLVIAEDDERPGDRLYIRAEFKVSVWGAVTQLGLGLENDMGLEKIWFQRV